ncbi:MAG: butyrate kinase [Propionibacteriaceae bacterium]
MTYILTVNPGATSTKIAAFEDTAELWRETINYDATDFAGMTSVFDQLERRYNDIKTILESRHSGMVFDATAGRGGLIGPVKPGAYVVNDALIDQLRNRPVLDHASNLGGALAREVARDFGIVDCPAFIYDPVTVDSMTDIARLTGLKGVERKSIGHHLNMRAVAMDLADTLGLGYKKANIIVVHMGGGSSASAHCQGEIVDFVSDDEIQFSAERSGGVPLKEITTLLKTMSPTELGTKLRKEAGLLSHCGTTDMREIESRIQAGDTAAETVVAAMGLQVAKCMASLAATLAGKVDGLILTGGMAHSSRLCDEVSKRTDFIAPFYPYPGEAELPALAGGVLRVLRGEEIANVMES